MSKKNSGGKVDTSGDVEESAYYGAKEREVLREAPAEPEATGFYRRTFLKGSIKRWAWPNRYMTCFT